MNRSKKFLYSMGLIIIIYMFTLSAMELPAPVAEEALEAAVPTETKEVKAETQVTPAPKEKLASEKPGNFSWLVDDQLCGLAWPQKPENLKYLEDKNVGLIVTLTAERNLDDKTFENVDLQRLYLPVPDFGVPTFEQANTFVEAANKAIKDGKAVAVHCRGGIGRTGTMLACWLVATKNMSAQDAIKLVRQKRSGSIETKAQEKFVDDYSKYLKKIKGGLSRAFEISQAKQKTETKESEAANNEDDDIYDS